MAKEPLQVYQIKITLNDSHPPIWRRIQVPGNISLLKLHDILQIVMGWTDSHLHQFTIDGQQYGNPQDDEWGELDLQPERRYRLGQVVRRAGARFQYEYDFGDSWEHTLLVEKMIAPQPGARYPQCLAGKRACPPEDVGGVWGYSEFLEALADPDHPRHEEYQAWIGGDFEAAAFDLDEVNARLRRMGRGGSAEADIAWSMEGLEPIERAINLAVVWPQGLLADERAVAQVLPLRQDLMALLNYLRDNTVTGTPSTGNLPLKAVRAICARFVAPPTLDHQVGDTIYHLRGEADVRPLLFLHVLAMLARWASGGSARRWRVTPLGEQLLGATAPQQVWLMFATWWTQMDWAFWLNFVPNGFLSPAFSRRLLQRLRAAPAADWMAFEPFANELIAAADLYWPIADQESAQDILQGIIERAALDPLHDFGVLEAQYGPDRILGARYQELMAFRITLFGRGLLEAMDNATRENSHE